MPNNTLDRAIDAVPKFGDRISLFTKKLRLAQYADSSIYNYRLKIAQAVLYLNKLPDDFTQEDIEDYLSMLLDRNRYSISFFKPTIFGLKEYYNVMGLKEPKGLVLPKVRKPKRIPRVLSQQQVALLLHRCELYDKTLLATIYDCALWTLLTRLICCPSIYFRAGLSGSATMESSHHATVRFSAASSSSYARLCRLLPTGRKNVPPVPKVRKKKSYLEIHFSLMRRKHRILYNH